MRDSPQKCHTKQPREWDRMPESSSNQTSTSGSADISVVICTRNRAAKLAVTLQALKSLRLPEGYSCEIVVIDNGSTDKTSSVCQSFRDAAGVPLRWQYVAEPGISRARNAGIKVSRGSIVAFTDDDVLPKSDWLDVIAREFATDPLVSVISGRVELQNPEDLPKSIRRLESRKEFHGVDDAFNTFIGCNFAVRRSVVDRIGLFDPEFGTGSRFQSAEDAEFSYRAWKCGEKVMYVPEMFVLHDHGRKTTQTMMSLIRGYIRGRGAFYAKFILQGDSTAARHMYWEIRSSLLDLRPGRENLGWRHPLWLLEGFVQYACCKATHILLPRSSD